MCPYIRGKDVPRDFLCVSNLIAQLVGIFCILEMRHLGIKSFSTIEL